MMAGLNATTAFNPLQALGQASAQKQGVPIPLTFGRETYYDPMPVDRPLGELPVETYEWNGSALNPVQPVGDVVDFRKRGLFPQLGTEGARGYAGGANPQGWNVGKPRTGSPEWNAQYESQAGLKPGSLEPSTRPPIQAEFPGRPAVPEMSAKQLGQAIRNRASEPRPDSLSPLMKPGMPGYNAKTDASQKNPALSKPADLSAERAWAQAETIMKATGQPTQMHINKWANEIGLKPQQVDQIVRGLRDSGSPVTENSVKFFVARMRQEGLFKPGGSK